MEKTNISDVKIDRELAKELRRFVFEKHGTLYGTIKLEVEDAVRKHIIRGRDEHNTSG